MAAILIDTTAVIDVLLGRAAAATRLRSLRGAGDSAHVCAITVEETLRGLRPREHDAPRDLFAGCEWLPWASRRVGRRSRSSEEIEGLHPP